MLKLPSCAFLPGLPLRSRILWGVLAAAVGGVFGVGVCELADACLLAISAETGVAVAFGILLFITGAFMVVRVYREEDKNKCVAVVNVALAAMMFFTGIWCFLLNRDIVPVVHWVWRICMYVMLGANLTFLYSYMIFELVGLIVSRLRCLPKLRSMQTRPQALTVLVGSLVTGVMYGFMFGWKEVALPHGFDAAAIAALVAADQMLTVPMGAVTGAVVGVVLIALRSQPDAYRLADDLGRDSFEYDADDPL